MKFALAITLTLAAFVALFISGAKVEETRLKREAAAHAGEPLALIGVVACGKSWQGAIEIDRAGVAHQLNITPEQLMAIVTSVGEDHAGVLTVCVETQS